MKVAITGANGFVGRNLIASCLRRDTDDIRALISERPGAEGELLGEFLSRALDVRCVDVRRPETLRGAFDGVETVVHTVAIPTERHGRFGDVNVGGVRNVIAEAERAGVRRFVHLAAIGASPGSPYPYLRSKGQGQAIVRGSRIPSVVLRPSLLFGAGDDFFPRLAFSLAFPVVPIPGDGKARFQPLHVRDLAAALRSAMHRPIHDVIGVHELGGPEVVTYDDLLGEAARALGKRRPVVHVPARLMKPGAWALGLLLRDPPVTSGQLDLLAVDNTCVENAIEPVFGVRPRPFRGGLAYLKR